MYDCNKIFRNGLKREQIKAIFCLAEIEVFDITPTENMYWPNSYREEIRANPWWRVNTILGIINVNIRKRVFEVEWTCTPMRIIVTKDQVTKSETLVHAYTIPKLLEYIIALKYAYVREENR